MTAVRPESAVCSLVVDGRPLPADYAKLVQSVRLTTTADGAGQLDINMAATDDLGRGFRVINERVLWPGREVDLWAGYGRHLTPRGRFRISKHRTRYGKLPTVALVGYDRLSDFLANTDALLFEGLSRNSAVIEQLLRERYPSLGWCIVDSPEREGDRFKAVNDTDLAFLKSMAEGDGFAYPRIWTRDQWDVAVQNATRAGKPVQSMLKGAHLNIRDVNLIYMPLSEVVTLSPTLRLHNLLKSRGGDWSNLEVEFSTEGLPTAVEVYGVERDGGNERVVRVVVEMTETGARVASVDAGFDNRWTRQQKIREQVKAGTAVKLCALSDERRSIETGGTYTYHNKAGVAVKGKSEQSVREVLSSYLVETQQDVVDFAVRWLQSRASAYLLAKGDLANIPGIEGVDVHQVHELDGVAEPHAGPYVVIDHVSDWSRQNGHTMGLTLQKLVEERDLAPTGLRLDARVETATA